jgi:dTMP kinase
MNTDEKALFSSSFRKRGSLFVFEGIDRCGKSTQVRLLSERFKVKDIPIVLYNFPNRETVIGKQIDAYLKGDNTLNDEEVHLLFSKNRWEMMDSIKDALKEGYNVVIDRYAYSGVAFSAAKGLDLDWCKKPDSGLLNPDAVIYLELSVDEAMKRANYGEERYEKRDFQFEVKRMYDVLRDDNWFIVDADKTPTELHNAIFYLIVSLLNEPTQCVEEMQRLTW